MTHSITATALDLKIADLIQTLGYDQAAQDIRDQKQTAVDTCNWFMRTRMMNEKQKAVIAAALYAQSFEGREMTETEKHTALKMARPTQA